MTVALTLDIQELKATFDFLDDWEERYRFIIDLGKEIRPLEDSQKTEANLIRGCQSQVWLTYTQQDEQLVFLLDSDAHIVRGLIAVVLIAINGKTADDIVALDIEGLFAELDLLAHLSLTRGNGLRAMILKIKQVAASLASVS
ncbi:MAG: SufE family protein [Gammaproteobacteria bacterium TMED134]|nr:MAG: SufE family protein [Gammaproteobacteria bacterium TMED134]